MLKIQPYKINDFYEFFGQDAEIVAKALSLYLTKRIQQGKPDLPMCGFPYMRKAEFQKTLASKDIELLEAIEGFPKKQR